MSVALPIPSSPKPATSKYQTNSAGEYTCPHCLYTARHMSTMHYHLKKHSGVTDYICKTCNKQFLQKQTLELHIHARHPETLRFPKTVKLRDLKAAREAKAGGLALPAPPPPATSVKVHSCPVTGCEFTSLSKGNCRIHCMRIHYGTYSNAQLERGADGTCTCKVCSANFKSLTHAYYHMASCLTTANLLPTKDAEFVRTHVL
jgi:hypothetical protein